MRNPGIIPLLAFIFGTFFSYLTILGVSKMWGVIEELRKNGKASYSERYDAWYDVKTGDWLEPKCSNPNCSYCANRPEKAYERRDD